MKKGLITSSIKLRKLYRKSLHKDKNSLAYQNYKRTFNKLKRISRRRHYQDLIETSKSNAIKLWNILNNGQRSNRVASLEKARCMYILYICFTKTKSISAVFKAI
jgi:hypothetical protein